MESPLSTPTRLDGTLFVSETRLLYVGPLVATTRHAHHAAQIVIAPSGLDVFDAANERIHTRAVVIPPRQPHAHGACEHAAMLFLDGDDLASRKLAREAEPRGQAWRRDSLAVPVPANPTPRDARALVASILAAVDVPLPPEPRHPATRRMCARLADEDPKGLAHLCHEVGLSPRQMRHAFSRDVGLSMRAYLRWKRLRRAVAAVERGATLSDAAAAAGFADSAHLSRVFREQFGMKPTQGLSSLTWRALD